jgi:hypothetical protein
MTCCKRRLSDESIEKGTSLLGKQPPVIASNEGGHGNASTSTHQLFTSSRSLDALNCCYKGGEQFCYAKAIRAFFNRGISIMTS